MLNLSQLTGMTSLPDMRFGSSCHTESLSTQSVYVQDRDFFIVCTSSVFQVADSSSGSLKELLNHLQHSCERYHVTVHLLRHTQPYPPLYTLSWISISHAPRVPKFWNKIRFIQRLHRGRFHLPSPRKKHTRLCVSRHPPSLLSSNPLTWVAWRMGQR